jgi:hypothetical protein
LIANTIRCPTILPPFIPLLFCCIGHVNEPTIMDFRSMLESIPMVVSWKLMGKATIKK